MSDPERRQRLHDKIDQLDQPQVLVVERFVDSVLGPVEQELAVRSWLTVPDWAAAFVARLRAHHGLTCEPLSTTAFEAAFRTSCEAAGWQVSPPPSSTNRFFDLVVAVPGCAARTLSLKSTSASSISKSSVHISKLTEAAWIQDARTKADRRIKLIELFRAYRDQTSGIVILRCFRRPAKALAYELLELPTSIFASVEQLSADQAWQATIPIPPGALVPDARIRLDRSDAKITLAAVRLEVCVLHGRWVITPAGA